MSHADLVKMEFVRDGSLNVLDLMVEEWREPNTNLAVLRLTHKPTGIIVVKRAYIITSETHHELLTELVNNLKLHYGEPEAPPANEIYVLWLGEHGTVVHKDQVRDLSKCLIDYSNSEAFALKKYVEVPL